MRPRLISQCEHCQGRHVAVRYTESAYAHFNMDGDGREDGHDIEECELDFSAVYCRDCRKKRTLTEIDGQLLEGTYEEDHGGEPSEDPNG